MEREIRRDRQDITVWVSTGQDRPGMKWNGMEWNGMEWNEESGRWTWSHELVSVSVCLLCVPCHAMPATSVNVVFIAVLFRCWWFVVRASCFYLYRHMAYDICR